MGFFVVVGYLAYMVGVYFFTIVLVRWISNNKLKLISRSILFLLFAVIPVLELLASNIAHAKLCDKVGGVHVISDPLPNSGIAIVDPLGCRLACINLLLSGAVPFVETEVKFVFDNQLTSEVGHFRFYLSSANDENCNDFFRKVKDESFHFSTLFHGEEKCLAFEETEKNDALLRLGFREGDQKIGIFDFEYIDRMLLEGSNKLIAYSRSIRVYSGHTANLFHPFQSKYCEENSDSVWWVQRVLTGDISEIEKNSGLRG